MTLPQDSIGTQRSWDNLRSYPVPTARCVITVLLVLQQRVCDADGLALLCQGDNPLEGIREEGCEEQIKPLCFNQL